MAESTPSTNIHDYGLAAFRQIAPGGNVADHLGWGLETIMIERLTASGWAGFESFVEDLNRLGHSLTLRQRVGCYCEYVGPVDGGAATLSVSVTVDGDFLTSSAMVESAIPQLRSPEEIALAAMHERFYEWYDRVGATTDDAASRLPDLDRIVYCCGRLEAEVNNGGFSQYFWNTELRLADDTLGILWAIGAEELATLLGRAIELAPSRMSGRGLEAALERMDAESGSRLSRLDARFCASTDDLPRLVLDFVEP